MPLDETYISGILACGLGLMEQFLPESCGVGGEGLCQTIVELACSSVQVVGTELALGLNTEWSCSFRVFLLSKPVV